MLALLGSRNHLLLSPIDPSPSQLLNQGSHEVQSQPVHRSWMGVSTVVRRFADNRSQRDVASLTFNARHASSPPRRSSVDDMAESLAPRTEFNTHDIAMNGASATTGPFG